jgi:hypothetical protein
MSIIATVRLTEDGLLVPRAMLQDWEEIEIVQRSTYLIIKPRQQNGQREQLIQEMKEAGLIVELHGQRPSVVTPQERAALAQRLSKGRPLSEIVIEERAERI